MTRTAFRHRRLLRMEKLESRQLMATVSGVVFNDLNGSGIRDVGETGLPGQTVFLDLNGNSAVDAAEPTMLTDANGAYSFPIPAVTEAQNLYVALALPTPVTSGPEANGRWQNIDNNYERIVIEPTTQNVSNLDFGLRFVSYSTFQPVGGETLVFENPLYRSFATDDAGNYVMVFSREAVGGQTQIYLQLFDANGSARGSQIEVTVAASGTSGVSMSRDGTRIALNWMQRDSRGSTAPFVQLFDTARLGDSSSGRIGSPIQIAPFGVDKSTKAPVTSQLVGLQMDNTGNFTVLMNVNKLRANIQFRRYTKDGAASGNVVNIDAGGIVNRAVRLAMDASGKFLVAWQGTSGILAQRYSTSGIAIGSRFVIAAEPNPAVNINLRFRSVTMNASGRFAFLWQEDAYGNPRDVAQAFNADGTRNAGLVSLMTPPGTMSDSLGASINAAGDVTFSFARNSSQYSSSSTLATDEASDIFVRQLSAGGSLSETQVVNSTTQGSQASPMVWSTPSGFIVTWLGTKTGGGNGVYTQQYQKIPPVATASLFAASSAVGNGSTVDYLLATDVEDPFDVKARNKSSRVSATR